MQTNNNPLPEIGVILIALSFIAAGTILLALRDIDLNTAISLSSVRAADRVSAAHSCVHARSWYIYCHATSHHDHAGQHAGGAKAIILV